jgi:AcrR family transcriptional regulator
MKNNTEVLIIEASSRVLLRENYQNMKTANIAKEAGIAEGTLYRYFKSKKEIFIAVIKYYFNSIADSVLSGISPENSLDKNLGILLDNFDSQLEEKNSIFKLFYKAYSEIEDAQIRTLLKDIYTEIIERIKTVLRWAENEIPLSEDKIEIIAFVISGIKDVLSQRHILGLNTTIEKKEIQLLKNIIFTLIEKIRKEKT